MPIPDAGPTPLQWLLLEIERTPGPAVSKERLRDILRGMAGQRIFVTRRDLHLPDVRRLARGLLGAGLPCADAAAALAAQTGLSRRHAHRHVVWALNERALQAVAARQMSLIEGGEDRGSA